MNRVLNSQAEFSKGAKTPEEAFDRQILSGNYMMFLIMLLKSGVKFIVFHLERKILML